MPAMSAGRRVVIVDDEPDMVENCSRILRRAGYRCSSATDPRQGLALVESERPDVLLTDLKMPAMDGMELLRRAREHDPTLPVIVITAFATIESAVAAVKQGAFDYLPKDFSVDQLTVAVERAVRQRQLQIENRNLRDQLQEALGLDNLVGRSSAMVAVFELVKKAARSEANILVLGESGTGKELVARAVHANSPRAPRGLSSRWTAPPCRRTCWSPSCSATSEAPPPVRSRPSSASSDGRGGTLFLDEDRGLGRSSLQVKLLRAVEERQMPRVGGTSVVDVDVRLVSASNRDLRDLVAKGQFREELYYRVNVIEIRLPPLRDRLGDLELLTQAFLKKYGQGRFAGFTDDAAAALEAYPWPGNVRELQNIIERACALTDGDRITRRDLPDHVLTGGRLAAVAGAGAGGSGGTVTPRADSPLKEAKERWMQVLEGSYLRDLLERHGGNISAAAKAAGIDRKTFHRLISKYHLK